MRGYYMNKPEELELKLHPRESETISLKIPKDTIESLRKVANSRDMSFQGLLKFYLGQGLREDLAQLFNYRVMKATEKVLANHIQSEEEIAKIMAEIRSETNP